MAPRENGEKPDAVCPRCGQHFVCGAARGLRECWCMERPLLPLESGEGGQCLCPDCFDRLLSERASPAA
ncbi:cysteine-rich CWC family protein [Propionivibrio sp.]|uniref:cysteine-rich CWC family protein n=1 Tax=Propionivibrio sp. TaxID=2212460 RepID=UPI0039E40A46